ncbi:hypothetical protein G9U51_02430 [Calidifontibacter sp. DB0510]|uniref:Uncharacterized protein n=1 Tax=Metallococcus carri TaxID=1656884 RepID=A0A967AY89_9MICO|nr:hypothetical protein [Metallococcus carri]NHN54637.1 hypothetical protein [Metallococcus carri]NOP36524.1 hypothetical protein [Calidifontibacter sp. DB2511S]
MRTVYVVRSPDAAAALADGRGLPYLAQYFTTARSIKEAADRLGEPLAKVHYWTRRWHELGLLEVVEERRRGGRPIRVYRTVAQLFEVPAGSLPHEKFEARMARSRRVQRAAAEEAVPELQHAAVLRVYNEGTDGQVSTDRTTDGAVRRGDILSCDFTVRLSAADARRLRDELEDLRNRWLERGTGRSGTHMVELAITPLPQD